MHNVGIPLQWLAAVALACFGLLVSNAPTPQQVLPTHVSMPWWQDIVGRYRLVEGLQVPPPSSGVDCIETLVTGEGFHRRIFFELICLPAVLFGFSNLPQQGGEITILQTIPPEFFVDPYELEHLNAVRKEALDWEIFGHADLEQPAPVCQPTVLALTLRNLGDRPQRQSSRPSYLSVDVPFHVKYSTPVSVSPECTSGPGFLRQFRVGPSTTVTWPAPTLLLRTESHRVTPDHEMVEQEVKGGDRGSATSPGRETTPGSLGFVAMANPPDAQFAQVGIQRNLPLGPQEPAHRSPDAPPQWALVGLRVQMPDMITVPTGCMLHAGWVSFITLISVLLCSGAVIAAAL
ncbi:hypothetical protein VOLCADRAFT_103795 [Volvox carteri f. nagariensis]|uniref:Protein PBN1 n=1 Tax=Volvox carteri f. nagariensis TaxID=3068 RepID=D8TP93_VOLCA|nr:uncharacterized protein VOLCADRAFT_103795 [Volvox carteri f. nagariensis]EFJ50721.1 hypothetical protein VOLCADRAFT_103795 [Volvox carteri f. nagariensis]|eukprot:XP_002948314.1 hypothetical protein VOLCADRAFT_103795 [Volvox carteri f. nagariensis]